MLGLSDKSGDIMRTVDKIEKIGPDLVRAILVDDYAIEGEKADEILASSASRHERRGARFS